MYSSFKKQQLITESWRRFLNEDKASLGDPIDLIDNFSATRQIRYKKGGYDSEFYKIEDVKSLYNKLNIIFQNRDLFEKYFAPGPYQTIERLQKAFIEKLEKDVGGIANTVDEENVNYNPFTELRRFLVELRKNKAKLEVPEEIKEKLSSLLNMLKSDQEQDFLTLQARAIPVIDVLIGEIKKNKFIDDKLKVLYTKRLGDIKNYILGSDTQQEFLEKSAESLKLFDKIDYPENFGALDKSTVSPNKFLKKISELLLSNIDYFNYDTSKLELLSRTVNDAKNQIGLSYGKVPENLTSLVDKLSEFLNKLVSILKGIETYKGQASNTPELRGKSEKDVVNLYNQAISKFKEENKDVYEIASKVLGEIEGYIVMRPPGPARSPFAPPETSQPSPPPLGGVRGYGLGPTAIAESKKSKRRR